MKGLVIDLFAGGGGVSTGIEAALDQPVDVAINHDPIALAVHKANHPKTLHLTCDIFEAKPREVCKGHPVMLLWLSPDCTHHSVAKGGKPRQQEIRSLADVGIDWAKQVRPAVIGLENVPEFRGWGPLDEHGQPIKARKGEDFDRWCNALRDLGYVLDWRVLDSSQYGAPTRRRRLFLIARCDGRPIVWPEPTHGPGLLPFHTAAECIDWSIPCPSIFDRKRPLAEKTMWRIAQGLKRFVFDNPRPFVIKVNHGNWEPRGESLDEPMSTVTATQRGHALVTPYIAQPGQRHGRGQEPIEKPLSTLVAKGRHAIAVPILQQSGYGERDGQDARVLDIQQPIGTLVNGQKHALVTAFLAKNFGNPLRSDGGGGVVVGSDLANPIATVTAKDHHSLAAVYLAKFRGTDPSQPGAGSVEEPIPTISAGGIHVAEVRAFLIAYYGNDGTGGQLLTEPLRTLTAKHRLGLVTVEGAEYQIVDIGFRMLEPVPELLRGQFGRFADGYDLSAATTKKDQTRLIGNSVPPEVVEALIRANFPERWAVAA